MGIPKKSVLGTVALAAIFMVFGLSTAFGGPPYNWPPNYPPGQGPLPDNPNFNYDRQEGNSLAGASANRQRAAQRAADAAHSSAQQRRQQRRQADEDASPDVWGLWVGPFFQHSSVHGMGASGSTERHNSGGSAFGLDLLLGEVLLGGSFDTGESKATYHDRYVSSEDESDFYGLTLYADWQHEQLRIYTGLGYAKYEHDTKSRAVIDSWGFYQKAELDTTALTAALIVEYTFPGEIVDVKPYAGVKYALVDTDSWRMGELKCRTEKLDSVRFPVGVEFSHTFWRNGFSLQPLLNFGVEPVCGDRVSEATVYSRSLGIDETAEARVTDGFYWNAFAGISAGWESVGFTLGYGFQMSSHEKTHGVTFGFDWHF
jgi:outer membrane autotransporter protein